MFACPCGFSAVFAFFPRNIGGSASLSSKCADEHAQNERGPSPLSPPLVVTTVSCRRGHRRRVPEQSRRPRRSERSSSRRTVSGQCDRGAEPRLQRHQHRNLCRRAKRSWRPRRQNRGRRHRRWWRSHRSDRQRRLCLGRSGHGTKLLRHRRRSSRLCSLFIRRLDAAAGAYRSRESTPKAASQRPGGSGTKRRAPLAVAPPVRVWSRFRRRFRRRCRGTCVATACWACLRQHVGARAGKPAHGDGIAVPISQHAGLPMCP